LTIWPFHTSKVMCASYLGSQFLIGIGAYPEHMIAHSLLEGARNPKKGVSHNNLRVAKDHWGGGTLFRKRGCPQMTSLGSKMRAGVRWMFTFIATSALICSNKEREDEMIKHLCGFRPNKRQTLYTRAHTLVCYCLFSSTSCNSSKSKYTPKQAYIER